MGFETETNESFREESTSNYISESTVIFLGYYVTWISKQRVFNGNLR